jgi:hypothetical protein
MCGIFEPLLLLTFARPRRLNRHALCHLHQLHYRVVQRRSVFNEGRLSEMWSDSAPKAPHRSLNRPLGTRGRRAIARRRPSTRSGGPPLAHPLIRRPGAALHFSSHPIASGVRIRQVEALCDAIRPALLWRTRLFFTRERSLVRNQPRPFQGGRAAGAVVSEGGRVTVGQSSPTIVLSISRARPTRAATASRVGPFTRSTGERSSAERSSR